MNAPFCPDNRLSISMKPVTGGKKYISEMRPETGVQPRMPENRMMSSSPHQKIGMEKPTRAVRRKSRGITIDEVAAFLSVAPTAIAKTLLVLAEADEHGKQAVIALVLRGDHELNEIKAEKLPGVANPLTFANDEQIKAAAGCDAGSIGPVGFAGRIIVDRSAAQLSDFVCGANETGFHLTGANWDRDIATYEVAALRNVVEGDPSPCGQGKLLLKRGIEVGHIFQLGTKYSEAMKASVLNEGGKSVTMEMGCYGIGVSRLVAAAIEQNNVQYGIIWPDAIAPFEVAIVPMNMHKSERVAEQAQQFYAELKAAGVDVLFDDRKERPGVMFADMELLGIPHAIVIGDRGLDKGVVEYKCRRTGEKQEVAISDIVAMIKYLVALHAGNKTTKGKRDGAEVDLRVDVDDIDEPLRISIDHGVGDLDVILPR